MRFTFVEHKALMYGARPLDYAPQVASLLGLLRDAPKLAFELPKSPNAIIEAEGFF